MKNFCVEQNTNIENDELLDKYKPHVKKIVMIAMDRHGHQDSLRERYEEAYAEIIEEFF